MFSKLFLIFILSFFVLPTLSFSKSTTDESEYTIEEIESRISDLNPPDKNLSENEFSLTDERGILHAEISDIRSMLSNKNDRLKTMDEINKTKSTVSDLVSEITKLDCKLKKNEVVASGKKIYEKVQWYNYSYVAESSETLENPWDDAPSANDEKIDSQELCLKWKEFIGDKDRQITLIGYFDKLKDTISIDMEQSNKKRSQASTLLDLLQKRKDIIEKRLSEQSTKSGLANNLWAVIAAIGFFGLGAIIAVRCFDEKIQMEWVISGQVIQFVTVMILLSVIMALGLAGILKENTLGTLLGGVAGYVLAQGVGRAAARDVSRERDRH